VRGVLIAEDVGDVAPANTKVLEKTLTLEEDTDDGDFNFSKPTNGWPLGKYRVEIYVNIAVAGSATVDIRSKSAEPLNSLSRRSRSILKDRLPTFVRNDGSDSSVVTQGNLSSS